MRLCGPGFRQGVPLSMDGKQELGVGTIDVNKASSAKRNYVRNRANRRSTPAPRGLTPCSRPGLPSSVEERAHGCRALRPTPSSTIQPASRRSLSTSTRWSKARCAGVVLPSAWNITGASAAAMLRSNSSSSSVSAQPGGSCQNSRHCRWTSRTRSGRSQT